MDKPDITTLPDDGQVILFLLESRLSYFDHHTLCSLAVNKAWNKLLLDTASERKKEFIKLHAFIPLIAGTVWHKYGSAFGNRRESRNFDGNPLWTLQGGYLRGNGLIPHNYERTNIIRAKLDWAPPKFNEQGDFVYYGVMSNSNSHTILEYGYPKNIPCCLLLEKDDFSESFVEMVPFMAFPNLLKVFLNNLEMHTNRTFKFCDVEKAIIPDDYKKCTADDEYKSYNELPEWWREVIDKRYREQKK